MLIFFNRCLCAVWFSEIIGSIAALPMDTQKKHWNVKPVLEALIVMCKFIIGNQQAEYVIQKKC